MYIWELLAYTELFNMWTSRTPREGMQRQILCLRICPLGFLYPDLSHPGRKLFSEGLLESDQHINQYFLLIIVHPHLTQILRRVRDSQQERGQVGTYQSKLPLDSESFPSCKLMFYSKHLCKQTYRQIGRQTDKC